MLRSARIIAFAIALIGLGILPGQAEKRIALVVGNSAYANVAPLTNPSNDAKLVAKTLRNLEFTLIGGDAQLDLDKAGLEGALQKFGNALIGADVALFYYAGHGVQIHGSNYVVPINANPVREADAGLQMVDVTLVLDQMEGSGTRLNLVVLDACRNNPFAGRGLRATGGGLAQMQAPEGTLISFATQPGSVARDGDDGHSPYSKAFARTITRPGLGIFEVFNEIGLAVEQATGGSQKPWMSNSPIKGTFYFSGPRSSKPSIVAVETRPEERAWSLTKDTASQAVLEDFIRQFGSSVYGSMARARLEELKKSQFAVVVPAERLKSSCEAASMGATLPRREAKPLSSDEECSLKPRDTFKECGKCPDMVVVPAGRFTMGSPPEERGRWDIEGPQHEVRIAAPFAAGRFAVTIDQFAAFVADSRRDMGTSCRTLEGGKTEAREGRSWRIPGFAHTGSHPVVCINFSDAEAYVAWLSAQTGKTYRLLTEAEWEYATRAGTRTRYSFGNDEKDLCRYGNGLDQSARSKLAGLTKLTFAPCNDGYIYTAPVGSFLPNPFGLYDMHGNVRQWVQDCFHGSYSDAPADGSAWMSGDCGTRVLRGGAWGYAPANLRSAFRIGIEPTLRRNFTGFRVARTLSR